MIPTNWSSGRQREKGAEGEALARQLLEREGLCWLYSNFRSRLGEIDLIMRDGTQLVFVEVRYRKNRQFGGAAQSVDAKKQHKLIRCAEYFLLQHPQFARLPCRFDVVALEPQAGQQMSCEWIKNAFAAH